MPRKEFENMVKLCAETNNEFIDDVIWVADTMMMIRLWFNDHDVEFTAADLVAAANAVQAHNIERTKERVGFATD